VYGHGSGDVALAFSTAYTVSHDVRTPTRYPSHMVHPAAVDPLFVATAEAVEQAIVHAVWRASSVTGRDGNQRRCLLAVAPDWQALMTGS
jgi:D-aminopeptidase